jgi:hypothetical protein
MTDVPDFKVIDMPTHMGRVVRRPDPNNPSAWIRDDDWYERDRKKHAALVMFLRSEALIRPEVALSEHIDDLVLRRSDLTDLGQQLVMRGAIDRWYSRHDRNPELSVEDVEYLRKELKKLRGGLA